MSPDPKSLEEVKKEFVEEITVTSKKLQVNCVRFSQMSLEEKLKELERLGQEEKELEGNLGVIHASKFHLENMQDVKEYRIKKDKFAVDLMKIFKAEGEVPYRRLYQGLHVKPDDMLLISYLWKLKNADLVEFEYMPNNEEIIKLTEKGKTFQAQ